MTSSIYRKAVDLLCRSEPTPLARDERVLCLLRNIIDTVEIATSQPPSALGKGDIRAAPATQIRKHKVGVVFRHILKRYLEKKNQSKISPWAPTLPRFVCV